jgi:hypothetical protein
MKYYRLLPDFMADELHWVLDPPVNASTKGEGMVWRFVQSQRLAEETEKLVVPIAEKGQRMELNLTAFGAWIVAPVVGKVISQFVRDSELQRIPCIVEDGTQMEILNTLISVDCFDHTRSEGVVYYTKLDRPEREGKVKWARRWFIDPTKADGRHLFRVKDDQLKLIASEDLKLALQMRGFGGAVFQAVS